MKRTYQPSKLVRKRRHGFRAQHGDRRWSQRDRGAPRTRSQAPVGLSRKPMAGAVADAMRPPPPARLKIRTDFLRVAAGHRVHSRSLSLQAARRAPDDVAGPRVGLTVSRKVGCAVERNRVKRRLREALRADLPTTTGHDFVVVARREALSTSFSALIAELRRCFGDHKAGRARKSGPRRKPGSQTADAKSLPSTNTHLPKTTDLAAGRGPAARDLRPDREPA